MAPSWWRYQNVGTTKARLKVEAVNNIFFDLSNTNFTIQAVPVVTSSLAGGSQSVQYSHSLAPDVTVSATDLDTLAANLTTNAVGLPAGLTLGLVSSSGSSTLPGSQIWKVTGTVTAGPGTSVTVSVTDDTGSTVSTSFTIVVANEDARPTYTGNNLFWTSSASAPART